MQSLDLCPHSQVQQEELVVLPFPDPMRPHHRIALSSRNKAAVTSTLGCRAQREGGAGPPHSKGVSDLPLAETDVLSSMPKSTQEIRRVLTIVS
jgi:hypothetical protein